MGQFAESQNVSEQGVSTEIDDVEKRLSELHVSIRSGGTEIPPNIYMDICDRLRDLEEAIAALRRSGS